MPELGRKKIHQLGGTGGQGREESTASTGFLASNRQRHQLFRSENTAPVTLWGQGS